MDKDAKDASWRGGLAIHHYTWLVRGVTLNLENRQGNFLDIRTAAGRLSVNPETLRRWDRKGGIITAYRTPGGYRRFLEADVDALLQQRKTEE